WCAARTRAEATEALEQARIPCGPVYSLDEVLADPQVQARRLIEHLDFPGAAHPVPVANTPLRLSATPGSIRKRAPRLGEHTDEVLAELGFTSADIAEMREAGTI